MAWLDIVSDYASSGKIELVLKIVPILKKLKVNEEFTETLAERTRNILPRKQNNVLTYCLKN